MLSRSIVCFVAWSFLACAPSADHVSVSPTRTTTGAVATPSAATAPADRCVRWGSYLAGPQFKGGRITSVKPAAPLPGQTVLVVMDGLSPGETARLHLGFPNSELGTHDLATGQADVSGHVELAFPLPRMSLLMPESDCVFVYVKGGNTFAAVVVPYAEPAGVVLDLSAVRAAEGSYCSRRTTDGSANVDVQPQRAEIGDNVRVTGAVPAGRYSISAGEFSESGPTLGTVEVVDGRLAGSVRLGLPKYFAGWCVPIVFGRQNLQVGESAPLYRAWILIED